jgi:hypothetical protein
MTRTLTTSQHYPTHTYVPSWRLRAVYVHTSVRKWWRKWRQWRDLLSRERLVTKDTVNPSVLRKVRATSALPSYLLFCTKVTGPQNRPLVAPIEKVSSLPVIETCKWLSGVMWGRLRLVFQLVGIDWCTVDTVKRYLLWTSLQGTLTKI